MVNSIVRFYLVIILAIALVACQTSSPEENAASPQVNREETQLVLNNAVLEQSNKQDNTVWKIKASNIIYSEDKQTADLESVVANLLQEDKIIILKLSANRGKIQENGNLIILQENIIASDPRNDSIIKSELAEWRPQENLLLIQEKLKGIRDNLEIVARSGKYLTDTETLEVTGDVVANTNEPALQLKSDRLIWNIVSNRVNSPEAVDLVRYNPDTKVTDKLIGDRGMVELNTHRATIEGNVEFVSLEPQIQAASEFMEWNYQQRIGKTNKPIQIIDREHQIVLTGNQGQIDFNRQQAILRDGIQGIDRKDKSELYARELTWNIDKETLEATGNIIYKQTDPPAKLTGDKAVGTLGNNNVVVTSNGKERVTSIIDRVD